MFHTDVSERKFQAGVQDIREKISMNRPGPIRSLIVFNTDLVCLHPTELL
jgi:hypothetical protein